LENPFEKGLKNEECWERFLRKFLEEEDVLRMEMMMEETMDEEQFL
jgi:hypothetical protein